MNIEQAPTPHAPLGFLSARSVASICRQTGEQPIFSELEFIRLSAGWEQSSHDPGLWGGASFDQRIFRQFQLRWAPLVTMDFWYRGFRVTPQTGNAFRSVLGRSGPVDVAELNSVKEVMGIAGQGLDTGRTTIARVAEIQSAEVGALKGKMVLAVRWEHKKLNRQYLSLFIDADDDGCTVHEIHFSAPSHLFDCHLAVATETLRTIQWRCFSPPPMSSIA